MSSEQMFNLIDKFTYKINYNDYKKIYISARFYELIQELSKNNLEWFSLEHIKLIKKYFFGIIDCLAIFYYNPTNLDILSVKIKKNIIK